MMKHCSATGLYCAISIAFAIVLSASPARAQSQPQPPTQPAPSSEFATGENYHVEFGAALWFPNPSISVASDSFGIVGSVIDFVTDLGLERKNLPNLRLVLRPAKRHKFRFEFIPIKYSQTHTLQKDIIFNGIRYRLGIPVTSTLDWKAYRFAYELDIVSVSRGFAGLVIEAKYTDVHVDLVSQLATEFARARAPIPAIGGIGRIYVVPKVSITGEFTAFKLPENLVKDTSAHYVDFDLYGTMNFTNNVGAQFGYRSLDVGYLRDTDTGQFTEKGVYFGIVARY